MDPVSIWAGDCLKAYFPNQTKYIRIWADTNGPQADYLAAGQRVKVYPANVYIWSTLRPNHKRETIRRRLIKKHMN